MATLRRARLAPTLVVLAGVLSLVSSSPVSASSSPNGLLHGFGGAAALADPPTVELVAVAATPTGGGYWLAAADGSVFGFGDAAYFGSMGAARLQSPIVAVARTPTGAGYWLTAADGSVFGFGDAPYFGSMGATRLAAPITELAPTPSGRGYWLVGADGSVFGFGDAPYFGSLGGVPQPSAIAAMATTPSGQGYWLVAADGTVANFGDAAALGSMTGRIGAPIVSIRSTLTGRGYWLLGADGAVFALGDAPYLGSAHGVLPPNGAATALAPTVSGDGYWIVAAVQRSLRIAATGDVHGEGRVRTLLERGGNPFADVGGVLTAADLSIINLETPVGAPGRPQPKTYVFLAPVSLLTTARAAGVDVVSLANNHALDHGVDALLRTLRHAREAGLTPVGAGANATEAYAAGYLAVRGRTVAVVGLTRVMSAGWAATATRPGVASAYDEPAAVQAVRVARAHADIVVVAIHWGVETARCPDAHQRRLSKLLRDAGADVVAGHHPHVLQGIDAGAAGVTAYSLGNFVWYHSKAPSNTTGILEVDVDVERRTTTRFSPARINDAGQPILLRGAEADQVRAEVARLRPGGGAC